MFAYRSFLFIYQKANDAKNKTFLYRFKQLFHLMRTVLVTMDKATTIIFK